VSHAAPPYSSPSHGPLNPDPMGERLNLLGILHYVFAGIYAVIGLIPLLHVTLGVMMLNGTIEPGPQDDPEELRTVGGIFVAVGLISVLFCQAYAVAVGFAGSKLRQRRGRMYCFVIACLVCLAIPLGTVLGVFTIITLMDEQVKSSFQANDST